MGWCLNDDVVAFGNLRLAVQRIAMSHWNGEYRLRSWGVAPLYRDGDALCVTCAPDEALWIGAWLEDESNAAVVKVYDVISGTSGEINLPGAYQLSAMEAEIGGSKEPLAIPSESGSRTYRLDISLPNSRVSIDLMLLPSATWAELSGRDPPDPLDEPPPHPPLLG